jgi:hypothetical protein
VDDKIAEIWVHDRDQAAYDAFFADLLPEAERSVASTSSS